MPDDVSSRVAAALDYMGADGADVREHYLWVLRKMFDEVTPDDLSTSALISLTAVIIPEHARVLAGRSPGGGHRDARVLQLLRPTSG
jgi:hypothetical protein